MQTDTAEHHPWSPFLPENACILFLGSFPPPRKRWCMDFYYPNFNNDHWRIEGEIFFHNRNHFVNAAQRCFDKEAIVTFCRQYGLAFYDTAKVVRRLKDNASDAFLEVVEAVNVQALTEQLPHCRAVITTGEKATATLCTQMNIDRIPSVNDHLVIPQFTNVDGRSIELCRLPSSSRAYPLAFERKTDAYRTMFRRYLPENIRP